MLKFFRNFFKSKFGVVFTLLFLALIAIAFASGDVANNAVFGGVSGGDRVAVVGDTKISTSDLSMSATSALEQARQQDPTLTMEAFVAQGGMDQVLESMLQRAAIAEFAHRNGMRAGGRLVDSEIVQIGAFRGADGSFDQDTFRNVIRQRGLTESAVREDIATGLLARQLITPASYGSKLPRKLALQYAKLLRETRNGSIATLESARFAPTGDPSAQQLQAYYSANGDDYIRPERRVLRYASFGEEALGDLPAPTQAQIAARYKQDAAQYQASESRTFTQLVAPTQAAAQAIVEEVRGGTSLAASASSKGLATTTVGPVTQAEMRTQTSADVAQAAFAASQGAIATPARGSLGWYVLKVDNIDRKPARSVEQVSGEIAETLTQEQRRAAFLDLAARIEEELDSGRNLAEVAKELDLDLKSTAPITADGRVYGQNQMAPGILARALSTAFEMEEEEPQLAEVEPGKTFLVYEVTDITPSATAPLAEIRDDVVADWRRSEGSKAAKAAADRIMKALRDGKSMSAAIAAEKVAIPPADTVSLSRQDLAQRQQVPPVLALMFSMAQGTAKKLEAPANAGWFVVDLKEISAPDVDPNDELVTATIAQLGPVLGDELTQEFVASISDEVGVERNQVAIDGLIAQITGRNQ